jgi:hypothetical protein
VTGFGFGYFLHKTGILHKHFFSLNYIHGLVVLAVYSWEKVLFFISCGYMLAFGVFDLGDTILQSFNFELMCFFVVRTFLNLLEPHQLDKMEEITKDKNFNIKSHSIEL